MSLINIARHFVVMVACWLGRQLRSVTTKLQASLTVLLPLYGSNHDLKYSLIHCAHDLVLVVSCRLMLQVNGS